MTPTTQTYSFIYSIFVLLDARLVPEKKRWRRKPTFFININCIIDKLWVKYTCHEMLSGKSDEEGNNYFSVLDTDDYRSTLKWVWANIMRLLCKPVS